MSSFAKQFALVWFFLIFLGVAVWAFWPSNKKKFDEMGRMPLDDEEEDKQAAAGKK